MNTRQEQKEKRRGKILEAALDQFIRKGYAATKIKDIANTANMSVGLLFHYFESKEELYMELIRIGTLAPRQMLTEMPVMESLEFFELCAKQVLAYAASSAFTAKMFVLMNGAYYSEGTPEKAREIAMSNNLYEQMVPIIKEGQKNKTIRKGNALSLSTAFFTALQGSIQAYALDSSMQLPEPEWIVDIIREKGE